MSGIILLVGVQNDCVLQYYASYLKDNGIDAFFVNQNRLGRDIQLDEQAIYLPGEQRIGHDEICGVLNRSLAIDPTQVRHRVRCAMELLYFWMDWVHPNVVNRPQHTLSNWSKPYQISQPLPSELRVPLSWVIKSKTPIQFGQEMIYKSISALRSIIRWPDAGGGRRIRGGQRIKGGRELKPSEF